MLFGNETAFGLCAFEKSFSKPSAGTNCNFGLIRIITNTFHIDFLTQQNIKTVTVVLFKNIIENIINRKYKSRCKYQHNGTGDNIPVDDPASEIDKRGNSQCH